MAVRIFVTVESARGFPRIMMFGSVGILRVDDHVRAEFVAQLEYYIFKFPYIRRLHVDSSGLKIKLQKARFFDYLKSRFRSVGFSSSEKAGHAFINLIKPILLSSHVSNSIKLSTYPLQAD